MGENTEPREYFESEDYLKPWFERRGLALLTDLYQLTMMAGYFEEKRGDIEVCFEYFFRSLPPHSGYAIFAGLDSFLLYLANLRFSKEDIEYLRSLNIFDDDFLDFLQNFKLHITVRSVPEGSLVFPFEPVVQVEGPLLEAQLVETALLNFLNFQTLIASKSARVCFAAEPDPVLEFGLRRAHGPDGGISASRSAYIGGCSATSNVMAGKVYGIPVAGTHAHSWVMSYQSELEAFRAFAKLYPTRCILLVDTYDPIRSGIPNAIQVFKELREQGINVRPAIRIDSGDLAKISKAAYKMMLEAGFENPLIVGSNDLNEDLIADLRRQGAKINAWGVGTHLVTSYDCPALSGVYKLVAVKRGNVWEPRLKITGNIEKSTDPGRKVTVRYFSKDGYILGDVMYLEEEEYPTMGDIDAKARLFPHISQKIEGATYCEELHKKVFHNGNILIPLESVHTIRERARQQLASLPEEYKRLRNPEVYKVLLSPKLGEMKNKIWQSSEMCMSLGEKK
ncbi:MAG: nicotinate phosphoribosyltransferase [Candidatus Hydrogenedentes bacterium]|nr:nicotinate phosphoribosyltransferase [Candidatus Hydrogenedentota bacterium]